MVDSAYEDLVGEAMLWVTVRRNMYGPVANDETLTVDEHTDIDFWSYPITVTDEDSVCVVYMASIFYVYFSTDKDCVCVVSTWHSHFMCALLQAIIVYVLCLCSVHISCVLRYRRRQCMCCVYVAFTFYVYFAILGLL